MLRGTEVFEAEFERNGSAQIQIYDTTPKLAPIFSPEPVEPKPQNQQYTGQIYRSGNVYMLMYGKEPQVAFTYGYDGSGHRFFGGESSHVSGQGSPDKEGGKQAYSIAIPFGADFTLRKEVAKYCKHPPVGAR